MSIKKVCKRPKKNAIDGEGDVETYFFDVEKCKVCALQEGAKTKSYSVTIKSQTHEKQEAFQEKEVFKKMSKHRYMIEAKNSELKHSYGLNRAKSGGLLNMKLQDATAIFTCNLNRIIRLMDTK